MSPVNNTPISYDDKDKRVIYRSYLLRLWCTDQSGECEWRASLEDSHTGEQVAFANLEQLFVFLMEQSTHSPKRDENPTKQ